MRTACQPSGLQLATLLGQVSDAASLKVAPGAAPPFFLDLGDGFDHRPVHECLERSLNGSSLDALPPGQAAHLAGWLLLKALERHPARTFDPAAAVLRLTGVTPSASYLAEARGCDAATVGSSHAQRMAHVCRVCTAQSRLQMAPNLPL